jgi:hypothetical protein
MLQKRSKKPLHDQKYAPQSAVPFSSFYGMILVSRHRPLLTLINRLVLVPIDMRPYLS